MVTLNYNWRMDEKRFSTKQGDIVYWVSRCANNDTPWLVFLPGLTADHSLFEPQLAYFEDKAHVLTWDAPAHRASRPYPLNFTMDDYARYVHEILAVEGAGKPVLIGQSLGGYVSQAYIDLYPGETAGFISIDSAPLQKHYMTNWEIWLLRHTKLMYLSIPWGLLVRLACTGISTTQAGRDNMREMMESYTKREYCELAAHGYRMLADAIDTERPYIIDCPALIMCGEKDAAASTRRYNSAWAEKGGMHLVWIPGAGHNATLDNPDFVNAQIEHFVEHL